MSRGCTPRHLRSTRGKRGWAISDESGLMCYADDRVKDVRLGTVKRGEEDSTPGFGTYHPQDLKRLGPLSDPTPIPDARPQPDTYPTKADLGFSDDEIKASIRQGRAPRRGY